MIVNKRNEHMPLLTDKDMIDFVILIIVAEHIIVAIKVLFSEILVDVPSWVQKKRVQVSNKQDLLNQQIKDQETGDEVAFMEKKLKDLKDTYAGDITALTQQYNQIKVASSKKIQEYDAQIDTLKQKRLEIKQDYGKLKRGYDPDALRA